MTVTNRSAPGLLVLQTKPSLYTVSKNTESRLLLRWTVLPELLIRAGSAKKEESTVLLCALVFVYMCVKHQWQANKCRSLCWVITGKSCYEMFSGRVVDVRHRRVSVMGRTEGCNTVRLGRAQRHCCYMTGFPNIKSRHARVVGIFFFFFFHFGLGRRGCGSFNTIMEWISHCQSLGTQITIISNSNEKKKISALLFFF